MRKYKAVQAAVLVCLLMTACTSRDTPPAPAVSSISQNDPARETKSSAVSEPSSEPVQTPPPENSYLDRLVADTIAKFATPEMTDYEKAKAAFDYMIANTILDEPIGLDLWRTHEDRQTPLSFVENRSLSVLQYGVGMCEDYAATFTTLLRGLGLEAEYIPGLTYSLQGNLVDHAWVMAKIDGVWYHLDCQLEDNISRHGAVRYRYFMKSDASMSASHRWGQNLIDSGLLTPAQNAEISEQFLYPPCPQDYPTPARLNFAETAAPDIPALTAKAAEEIAAYERENGALPPLELDTIPPVFGLDGFGPQDEG